MNAKIFNAYLHELNSQIKFASELNCVEVVELLHKKRCILYRVYLEPKVTLTESELKIGFKPLRIKNQKRPIFKSNPLCLNIQ